MSNKQTKSGSELFIVDNGDSDWKVGRYLHEWANLAHTFDIATGYFEIGALLSLDGEWQKLDKIRLLMGDEVTKRTKSAFEQALGSLLGKLDQSIEDEKAENDFLTGVPAIVEAIRTGKIEARVYRKRKFHAKAYITHSKFDVVGSSALVGSSNFTYPGLNENIELNIQLRREVDELQEWFEKHWQEAEDATPEILRTIERHTHGYLPFDVYTRAMAAYFRSHEVSVGEWEQTKSKIYPILSQYQREGYHSLMQIARRYNGALLCDGVGLGKTFIGLMVIERLLFERKKVALFVPKSAREDVWEAKLRQVLPEVRGRLSNLVIYNHTDLLREGEYQELMDEVAEKVDAIVIDEAHNFRNIASSRSRRLFDMTAGKQLFLLTATPVNNSLYDLMHLIEYFSRRQPGYFSEAPLGIHTLRGHFRNMEEALEELVENGSSVELDPLAADHVLSRDDLFQALVVQRSRAYVKRSLAQEESDIQAAFPTRQDPQVAAYSLEKTYGGLLAKVQRAFDNQLPLVRLPIYYPIAYLRRDDGSIDPFERGRQMQIVGLIRTLLLKRFESSAIAFQSTCEDLLFRLLYFVQLHNPRTASRWEDQHRKLVDRVEQHMHERGVTGDEEEQDEDVIPEEFKTRIVKLDDSQYDVTTMVLDTLLDLDELAGFLDELEDFSPAGDDKVQVLIHLMKTDPVLSKHKVLIFTEFRDTARYITDQLAAAGIGPLSEVDSLSKGGKDGLSRIIRSFAPYYNNSNSAALKADGIQEVRVMVSTDILSEGLNLQDSTCIINYDLHWNPVRLMQRIGRVDRRLDPQIEQVMIADHPEMQAVRGTVRLWNFLPPAELNSILSLYGRVTHKTLRISKTFGIEGKKLLTPQDDYAALREFNQAYEGTTTKVEEMFLAYQELLNALPHLQEEMAAMPLRLFSGKAHSEPGAQAIFFCYRLPGKDAAGEWTEDASFTRWYLYQLDSGEILDDATRIFHAIQCVPATPRRTVMDQAKLAEIRREMDKHILNSYMKKVQAPLGVNPTLLAWMELN